MIGQNGPELHAVAIKKLKLSKLQSDEINRMFQDYRREYLSLQRRHTKISKDEKKRILVTIAPFTEECQELAKRLVTELGGIVDFSILPQPKVGALPTQIFSWGGECNETITLWKEGGNYHIEEKLTAAPGLSRDPYTFNMSGPKLEEIPEEFRIYWREE